MGKRDGELKLSGRQPTERDACLPDAGWVEPRRTAGSMKRSCAMADDAGVGFPI